MGRVRQKKKNRSSINKVRPHRKPVLKVPLDATLAARWNRKETLSQNYRRLGLTARLKGPTGGVEKKTIDDGHTTNAKKAGDTLAITPSSITARPSTIAPSEVRVERDVKGAIVRVIRDVAPAANNTQSNPLNDPLNELSSDDEASEGLGSERRHESTDAQRGEEGRDLIQELEAVARRGEGSRKPKKLHPREAEWIAGLVDVYGEDYDKMFWDRKRNPLQLTANDLRRRVERWRRETEGVGDDRRVIQNQE